MARFSFMLVVLRCGTAAEIKVSVAGQPVDVWSAVEQLHKCGDIDVPDVPAKVFDDDSGDTQF